MQDDNKKRPGGDDTPRGRTQEVDPMSRRKPSRAPERGHRVAAARKRAGLTQQALAERTGLAKSTIARIELGQHQPSISIALAIAKELDTTAEALWGGGR